MNGFSTLRNLAIRRKGNRLRSSSYDREGGNNDFAPVATEETHVAADIKGAGCITHIWMTCTESPRRRDTLFLRNLVLRIYWDGEEDPSVHVPLGDFFGMGHSRAENFSSAPLAMSPENGMGLNCYFAMPFSDGCRIEIANEHFSPVRVYYYIDYESYDSLPDDHLRFHACWNRQNPCEGLDDDGNNEFYQFGGKNTTGADNYVILEAEGLGHYVGCHLDIHNLRVTDRANWYGEGDDMIFIDGEAWPPRLHGTGTEDYFNTAWCPTQTQCTPYHGIILAGGPNWSGKISTYRYHIEDPIMFNSSIRVTIEHGHNNHRSDDYSSTAYWYQTEPHKPLGPLPPPDERRPLPEVRRDDPDEIRKYLRV